MKDHMYLNHTETLSICVGKKIFFLHVSQSLIPQNDYVL